MYQKRVVSNNYCRVEWNGVMFYKTPEPIEQLIQSPEIYFSQTIFFKDDLPKIMGKLLDLFGQPNGRKSHPLISREYDLAGVYNNNTYYFKVYDWCADQVRISFEHSLLPAGEGLTSWTRVNKKYYIAKKNRIEKIIEKKFVELIEEHGDLCDFKEKFKYNGITYGVKNGKPYFNYKKS
ncbi:hypothetical protein [Halothermothrix orenii]|uniref:Uncharacterized protein n=1 Tax=Halothermothrix orenii (strain H 168 / OCM 544 / DSM 9562) TaxID=373903 RepID=B8CX43_HALOH|nr:hypothetical protein [Halothermothrix orenii]ACL69862.1 hypothetical protein Hore_11090 [Halothermothrix orenii H 168]